jgi:CheY-like chemotaxis protein
MEDTVEPRWQPAPTLVGTEVVSDGRIYSPGGTDGGMWWKPLNSPDGAPRGAARSQTKNEAKDILVVEDEAYLCDLIADVLESDGHKARKASNGREALAMLEERRPQLILLDLMMPIMDGWEFITVLKSRPQWADVPVIIITAIYDARRTQLETGAKAVITKPFDIDQLAELVDLYAS